MMFNFSGIDGIHGIDGTNLIKNMDRETNIDGCHGEDGKRGTAGTNGDDIVVTIKSQPDGTISISGRAYNSKSTAVTQYINETILFDDFKNDSIKIISIGGKGGDGGSGMNGEDGKSGKIGDDATENKEGSDGTNGGNGGNGGNGANGSNGGNGGNIFITVSENDMHLLSYLQCDNRGGVGGIAGLHGKGGERGWGGVGGNSHTWASIVCSLNSYAYGIGTLVTPRYNAGGMAGTNGTRGRDPDEKKVYNGKNGISGIIQYIVEHKTTNKIYSSGIYVPTIIGFDIVPSNDQSGIYEFGDSITIKNIVIKNNGSMPFPKKQQIGAFVKVSAIDGSDQLINCKAVKKNIDYKSEIDEIGETKICDLRPNESYALNTEYTFVCKDTRLFSQQNTKELLQRYNVSVQPILECSYDKIFNRGYAKVIDIKYPINMNNIDGPKILRGGEVYSFHLTLNNISSVDFGQDIDKHGVDILNKHQTMDNSRCVKLKYYIECDDNRWIGFYNNDSIKSNKKEENIAISKNSKTNFTVIVGVAPDALSFKTVNLRIELYLQSLDANKDDDNDDLGFVLIQTQNYACQINSLFISDQNDMSDDEQSVLLITNKTNDSFNLDAYRTTYNQLGIPLIIYNSSISNVDFDIIDKHFKGRSIIILNNSNDEENFIQSLESKIKDMYNFIENKKAKIYFDSFDSDIIIKCLLYPTKYSSINDSDKRLPSRQELIDDIYDTKKFDESRILIPHKIYLVTPTKETFVEYSNSVIQQLKDTFPGHRYVCKTDTKIEHTGGYAYNLGNVHVLKTLTDTSCSIITSKKSCDESDKYIVFGRLFLLLPFKDKIEALIRLQFHDNGSVPQLTDPIVKKIIIMRTMLCFDIIQEFIELYNSTNKYKKITDEYIESKMTNLKYLLGIHSNHTQYQELITVLEMVYIMVDSMNIGRIYSTYFFAKNILDIMSKLYRSHDIKEVNSMDLEKKNLFEFIDLIKEKYEIDIDCSKYPLLGLSEGE
jgi:hypothetical protein